MTAFTTPAEVDGLYVGAYRLQSLLGTGSFGLVYAAYQPFLDRKVAVKLLQTEVLVGQFTETQFMQEARTIAKLRHPNIVGVYEFGIAPHNDKPITYMVMEHLPGETLQSLLKRGPLPVEQIIEIAEQLASALDYAHARNIVHRDLKPANIMFSDQNQPVIVDFGLARLAEISVRQDGQDTASTTTTGTPAYMSPEQATGRYAGPASDQYSLALIVYEMLTQRMPFNSHTINEIIREKLNNPPILVTSINSAYPAAVDMVFIRALAHEPQARYATATDFARELSEALMPERKTRIITVTDPVQAAQLRSARQTVLGFMYGLMLVTLVLVLFSLSVFIRDYLGGASPFIWDGIIASNSITDGYHDVIALWPGGPAERAGILRGDRIKTDLYYEPAVKDGDFMVNGKPRSAYPTNWQAQAGDVITRQVLRNGTPVNVSYTLERSPYNLLILLVELPAAILAFICAPWLLRRWGPEPGVQVFALILMASCFTLVANGVTNVLTNIDSLAVLTLLPLLLHLMLIFPEPLPYFQTHPRHIWLIYLPFPIGLLEFLFGVSLFDTLNLALYSTYMILLIGVLIFKWWRRDLKHYRALSLLLMTWLVASIGIPLVQAIYILDDYSHVKALWGGNGLLLLAVDYSLIIFVSIFCVTVGTLGINRVQRMLGRSVEMESVLDADSSKTLVFT